MLHTAWIIWRVLYYTVPLVLLAAFGVAVGRFMFLPPAAKRNYPAAWWARVRWRWLARNLGLAYVDEHRPAVKPLPFGTSAPHPQPGTARLRLRFPRASIRADAFGIVARVRTVPKVGRLDFEDSAPYIADAWRCHRVQVHQPKPGRLVVRGLRLDPLTLPYPLDELPDVYSSTGGYPSGPLRLYVGRDEWGEHRWFHLPGTTGITVGGLPGLGKTSLVNSWLCQLAGLPAQFVIIDGKGGGDYTEWADRAALYTDDDLHDAAGALAVTHSVMRHRLATVQEVTGSRNGWHIGPTEAFPLVVVVIDECHTFFDLDGVRGNTKAAKSAETDVRQCRNLAGQIIKKGRAALCVVILITQKQTSDAIPTALRDNCGLGLSFGVKTRDAAVAALGEQIREYPTYCPTGLQSQPDYVGVCTAGMRRAGVSDPYVRLRVPPISEAQAAARARETLPVKEVSACLALPQEQARVMVGAT